MKDISEVTACVIDHRGLFLGVAHRMAQVCKRVLHWSNYEDGFSRIRNGIIGDGFDHIEWCKDPWKVKKEVDLFVFPDIEMSGMQLELASQGFPVWGVRNADSVELDREKFLKLLTAHNMAIAAHAVIQGLENLRVYLRDKENKWIKISKWRGDIETTHWRNWKLDRDVLDAWGVELGPTQDYMRFIVFDDIDTDLEIGVDTYCVNGAWPRHMINGLEGKSKAYFGIVTKREHMPRPGLEALAMLSELFEQEDYRGQFSAEIRISDDVAYFIDPCCRGGFPSTSAQLRLWKNFPEIVWAGANGELLDPEYDEEFAVECRVKCDPEKEGWRVLQIPNELNPWIDFQQNCQIDNTLCFPPDDKRAERVGWMAAIGKTPKEVVETMGEYVDILPDGMTAEYVALADILAEIETAIDQNIPMTDEPIPEPSTVIES